MVHALHATRMLPPKIIEMRQFQGYQDAAADLRRTRFMKHSGKRHIHYVSTEL